MMRTKILLALVCAGMAASAMAGQTPYEDLLQRFGNATLKLDLSSVPEGGLSTGYYLRCHHVFADQPSTFERGTLSKHFELENDGGPLFPGRRVLYLDGPVEYLSHRFGWTVPGGTSVIEDLGDSIVSVFKYQRVMGGTWVEFKQRRFFRQELTPTGGLAYVFFIVEDENLQSGDRTLNASGYCVP